MDFVIVSNVLFRPYASRSSPTVQASESTWFERVQTRRMKSKELTLDQLNTKLILINQKTQSENTNKKNLKTEYLCIDRGGSRIFSRKGVFSKKNSKTFSTFFLGRSN